MIFRGDVSGIRFPEQVTPHAPTAEELAQLRPLVERWCALFGGDAAALLEGPLYCGDAGQQEPLPADVCRQLTNFGKAGA